MDETIFKWMVLDKGLALIIIITNIPSSSVMYWFPFTETFQGEPVLGRSRMTSVLTEAGGSIHDFL